MVCFQYGSLRKVGSTGPLFCRINRRSVPSWGRLESRFLRRLLGFVAPAPMLPRLTCALSAAFSSFTASMLVRNQAGFGVLSGLLCALYGVVLPLDIPLFLTFAYFPDGRRHFIKPAKLLPTFLKDPVVCVAVASEEQGAHGQVHQEGPGPEAASPLRSFARPVDSAGPSLLLPPFVALGPTPQAPAASIGVA